MSLITPDVIENQALEVLRTLHPQHLARLERERGLEPGTVDHLVTIDRLAGEGFRLNTDDPPAALLGIFGTAGMPEPEKGGALVFQWTLAVEVTAVGTDREDTMKARGWYAMTVAECLLQRLPRQSEPIDAMWLADVDFGNGRAAAEEDQRWLGEAQLLFEVRVRGSLGLHDLPPADTQVPPGTPGGPPAGPYDPPAPWPQVAKATTTIDRKPLHE